MTKQGPSNEWELETRRILQERLPEYDVDPHMRLANVVKGKIRFIRAMSQYEIDFTVREKETGKVICAIELDGPTHDTKDGQRRDANKNRWLDEARITLIRIQKPEDARTIRQKLRLPDNFKISHEDIPIFMRPKQSKNQVTRYIASLIATIAIVGLLMWTLNTGAQKMLSNLGKSAITQQQRVKEQQATAQQTQAVEQAEAQRRVAAQQPRYEQVLVKGKSARECANGNVISNETILCTKNHFEMVLVNGTQ